MSTICPLNICSQSCHCETGKNDELIELDKMSVANSDLGQNIEEPFVDLIYSKVFGIPLG